VARRRVQFYAFTFAQPLRQQYTTGYVVLSVQKFRVVVVTYGPPPPPIKIFLSKTNISPWKIVPLVALLTAIHKLLLASTCRITNSHLKNIKKILHLDCSLVTYTELFSLSLCFSRTSFKKRKKIKQGTVPNRFRKFSSRADSRIRTFD
jgi:hypothetical protein